MTINRSVASGNDGSGFLAASGGATAELSCEECVSSSNGGGFLVGAVAGSSATIRVSHSAATNNTNNGFAQFFGGVFESLANNLVRGNPGGPTTGTITVIPAQ